ncbi:MAG: D-cysteine desulfhydrase family protein [Cyanobacteria bacterium P01_F01_bin.42]
MSERSPRVSLGFFPTPLEPLSRLSNALQGPNIWIKRDDQTGLACGGNKTRKLEFLMADAIAQGSDTVITAGAAQSNHCRQTAAAAAKLGLHCHLLLGGTAPSDITGNLLLDSLFNAQIHWAGTDRKGEALHDLQHQLQAQDLKPYLVPYGGSNPIGAQGFVAAIAELKSQLDSLKVELDAIIVASSSGGTQAGMAAGLRQQGIDCQLIGISIDKDEGSTAYEESLAALASDALQESFLPSDFTVDRSYLGDGYGVVGTAEREAIALLARTEGILVDPVYSGRAFAGMLDLINRGAFAHARNILFWHTGGTPAIFAYGAQLL